MQQLLATSPHLAPFAFARLHPSVRPAAEAAGSELGRRLPRFDRQPRQTQPVALTVGSFLDHLRRADA